MADDAVRPRSFFLNEQHELTRGEKDGGGPPAKLAPLDWGAKGQRLAASLALSIRQLAQTDDPAKDNHLYLLAKPQKTVAKITADKQNLAVGIDRLDEPTSFASKDSRVFSRLGMDLLRVSNEGDALIHVTPSRAQQLELTANTLKESGVREQARWVTLDSFTTIPLALRVDEEWLASVGKSDTPDSVIELQPLLSRLEIDAVMRSIAALVQVNAPKGQSIRGNGSDYSGRHWLKATLSKSAIELIGSRFASVQSLHAPLTSTVNGNSPIYAVSSQMPVNYVGAASNLPTVAVVDTGIPTNHASLALFRRDGGYAVPWNQGGVGSHGCFVASRVVFGDLPTDPSGTAPNAALRFFDVNVALGPNQIDDKMLLDALEAVRRTTPDIRVFNLSFDNKPLGTLPPVQRAETLALAQDLDNFVFENDVVVVVCSGNAQPGILPTTGYPNHVSDPNWGLGAFASSFNSLTCASYVSHLSAGALVGEIGWPSPFSRVGPGLNGSPKPDFSAPGGNSNPNYGCDAGMGVWGLDEIGTWKDRCGTSYAAPILAREVALAFDRLSTVCAPNTRPFATTVKAFLALTARRFASPAMSVNFADIGLGLGAASIERLTNPLPSSAVFVWQGILEDKNDQARLQLPIPRSWIDSARSPMLRLITAADVPVDSAAVGIWASRKIVSALRPHPAERAIIGKRRNPNEAYPLTTKTFNLTGQKKKDSFGDIWTLEISYEQIADYLPTLSFTSQQRVSIAAELYDATAAGLSPQATLQSMAFTQTMTNLSVSSVVSQTPVMLRTYE